MKKKYYNTKDRQWPTQAELNELKLPISKCDNFKQNSQAMDFRVSFSLELHIFAVVFITFTFEYGSVHITFFLHRPDSQPIKFTIE